MPELAPLEIRALTKIMDELSYYQLLHVADDASASDIKQAYYKTSRAFHPDANRQLESALLDECERITKRITEAYCVLRDPRKRQSYDAQRKSTHGAPRIQLAEARAAHAKRDTEERQGKTPQGRQFFQRGETALKGGKAVEAVGHFQMALTFEPGNEHFQRKLDEARKARP